MQPDEKKPLLDDYMRPDELRRAVWDLQSNPRPLARARYRAAKETIGRKVYYKRSSVTEWLDARERRTAA